MTVRNHASYNKDQNHEKLTNTTKPPERVKDQNPLPQKNKKMSNKTKPIVTDQEDQVQKPLTTEQGPKLPKSDEHHKAT